MLFTLSLFFFGIIDFLANKYNHHQMINSNSDQPFTIEKSKYQPTVISTPSKELSSRNCVANFGQNYIAPFIGCTITDISTKVGIEWLLNSKKVPVFCARDVFGESLRQALDTYQIQPIRDLRGWIGQTFKTGIPPAAGWDIDVSEALAGVALEEIITRGAIQELLLRQAPKKIIGTYFPRYTRLVDHPLTRITRVGLSSLAFALQHTKNWHCAPGGGLSYQFAGGVLLGAVMELTGSIALTTAIHFEANWYPISRPVVKTAMVVFSGLKSSLGW